MPNGITRQPELPSRKTRLAIKAIMGVKNTADYSQLEKFIMPNCIHRINFRKRLV
jgi:hypothetical protein